MTIANVPYFVFVRGAPGVGKSSVAAQLRSSFCAGVAIEIDTIRMCFTGLRWDDDTQYADVFGGISLMALHFQECGYGPIIIVGHVTGSMLDEWEKAGVKGEIRVYTLTASDSILKERIQERLGHGFVDHEFSSVVSRRIHPIAKWPEVIIDTSALDPAGVCKIILQDMAIESSSVEGDAGVFIQNE